MAETIPLSFNQSGTEWTMMDDCKHDSSLQLMSNQKCPALFLGVKEGHLLERAGYGHFPFPKEVPGPGGRESSQLTIRRTSRDNTTDIETA